MEAMPAKHRHHNKSSHARSNLSHVSIQLGRREKTEYGTKRGNVDQNQRSLSGKTCLE